MIICKSPKEIEILKKGNQVVAFILKELKKNCQPGVTTLELDQIADRLIKKIIVSLLSKVTEITRPRFASR
jgi:methionine aminopeptidase, type I (EC 3.4.11.18)